MCCAVKAVGRKACLVFFFGSGNRRVASTTVSRQQDASEAAKRSFAPADGGEMGWKGISGMTPPICLLPASH